MPDDRPGPFNGPFGSQFDDLFGNLLGNLGARDLGTATPGAAAPRAPGAARTPTLDRYGRDLTAAAAAGDLDPVIGRDAEIGQVLEVLARRTKNNPVLLGDPGVGKTAIVEGIAARVHEGRVPESLRGVRVVALDLAGLVAGTRYRGDFEQRLTTVIDEVVGARRSVVLFVDELHAVVGAGSAEGNAMDAATLLKPTLARGDLQLIGATTVADYRRHVERDGALERRFAPVRIGEPTVEQTVAILRGLRSRYEDHHDVRITDDALEAAARLSDRHVTDRFLPDKAVDLVDRAAARARIRATDAAHGDERVEQLRRARDVAVDAEDYERAHLLTREIDALAGGPDGVVVVGADDVADVLARGSGIPVARLTADERSRLLGLEDLLRRRVVGQDEAVAAVADAVRAGRAGLAHPDRPVGSLLFVGPPGVGKTELARALAEALFGDEDALLRFDMTEYADRASAFRLVGAPPGHLGHDEPGLLTEAVRRSPHSVLLLDEIDKAHPEVAATLLQLLDAGRLTDAHGRTVAFRHTVVIMTSNVAAQPLPGTGDDPLAALRELAVQRLRPEFLDRVDDVVTFGSLGPAELRAITAMLLAHTAERLAGHGVALEVTEAALDRLATAGPGPEPGARPLRRRVSRDVERPLARLFVGGELAPGSRVVVDAPGAGPLTFGCRAGA